MSPFLYTNVLSIHVDLATGSNCTFCAVSSTHACLYCVCVCVCVCVCARALYCAKTVVELWKNVSGLFQVPLLPLAILLLFVLFMASLCDAIKGVR